MKTLAELARSLAAGTTTSRQLVEECLARIADPKGEGPRTFLQVHAEAARAAAEYHDRLHAHGVTLSPWAGIPVSIKDLFDMAGEVTTAGSKVLRGQPPASTDCTAVARLRAAGFIPIGRTNMTEFAYSGLGLNPHYGTPLSPFERLRRRAPGGSSSGAAVSIVEQMSYGALGTDTGGSCRIPAAFCGIVGFKPTARRIPLTGVFPLSRTLDSVGPLAASVACCAVLDAVLAAEPSAGLDVLALRGRRFAVPTHYALDSLDTQVASSFERAVREVSSAGAEVNEIPLAELDELPRINRHGGFSGPEAFALHRERLESQGALYDPRVLIRLQRGREQSAVDYLDLIRARADLQRRVDRSLAEFDALLLPTAPIIAPLLQDLESDEAYLRTNQLALRNTSVANFLDRCAVSIPCHERGTAPVGLMLMGSHGGDRRMLAIAAAVEACVNVDTDPPA
ncbi:MAG TPA: amidase [Steroidobacteraceae bacterium]|jgi:aspartyl-tRNA(Asn)/glutamyl-tRNA(Gln) amidotransferase subunit A|nr:amidase [Steroidobacteraceae bacterium]